MACVCAQLMHLPRLLCLSVCLVQMYSKIMDVCMFLDPSKTGMLLCPYSIVYSKIKVLLYERSQAGQFFSLVQSCISLDIILTQ